MFKLIIGALFISLAGLAFWLNLAKAPIQNQLTKPNTSSSSATTSPSGLPASAPAEQLPVAKPIIPETQAVPSPKPVVIEPTKPKPSPAPVVSTSTQPIAKPVILIKDVPFIIQAPRANWSDPLQENGCEEASVLMAVAWARDLSFDAASAESEIIAMGEAQIENYGSAVDTDAFDTVTRIFKDYWDFNSAKASSDFSKANLISHLSAGRLVIIPANGRLLKNPYFTPPGPTTHMLVIIGYDPNSDEFITHDPGTRRGANFRYPAARLLSAAVNYPTGDHEIQDPSRKAFISVSR